MSTIALSPISLQTAGVFFVVPNSLSNTNGNDGTRLPFSYLGEVRYQQVYDASQFSLLPPGGAFLTRIFLIVDCGSTWSWLVTNLQVNVSTTKKGPDALSPVFAENIGSDEIITAGPAPYGPALAGCGNSSAGEIRVQVPFFYDPTKGNLLLDLRNFGIEFHLGDPVLDSLKMDAQTVLGDSISRAAAFSLSTNTAEVIDTTGLVTAFQFDPTPALTNRFETNTVILTWPTLPNTFQLQCTDRLGLGSVWSNYTGHIGGGGVYRIVTIPAGSLKTAEFFRLFWQTPQPLSSRARGAGSPNRLLQTK